MKQLSEITVSKAIIKRLPRYYRYLEELRNEGVERISSGELSERMKVTASQIRQDLNHFGGFGQQGYGYKVDYLYQEIGKILGLDRIKRLILIGAGHLGTALANYTNYRNRGFFIEAIFDRDPEKHLHRPDNDIMIYPLEEMETYLKDHQIDIAVIAIPADAARKIIPILDKGGVKGIWNFARTDLDVPDYMTVQSVHLSESLMQLSYKINH